jgi:hypothetical protein
VSLSTAVLPSEWQNRLASIATPGAAPARARCLEPHDCVVSKLVAARDKDRAIAAALIRERLVEPEVLLARIGDLPHADVRVVARLGAWVRREAGLYR